MAKFKYKQAVVTVGDNFQTVRQLTNGDRVQFVSFVKEAKDGKRERIEGPGILVRLAAIEPTLTQEDVESMPPELVDACARKIMELSGMSAGDDQDEKKTE